MQDRLQGPRQTSWLRGTDLCRFLMLPAISFTVQRLMLAALVQIMNKGGAD